MTKNEKYVREIFKIVKTNSILIIGGDDKFRRLVCPFVVLVIVDIPPLKEG